MHRTLLQPRFVASFLVLLTVAVLFARRPDQFFHPYVWIEDKEALRSYLDHGIGLLLVPTSGYMITATKIIDYIAFRTSISWTPEIQVALTVLFTSAVIVAIALSPSHLKSPVFCSLAALLVPLNSEQFAVSAYAFWWAGLLLIIALLWDETKQPLRWLFILLGGLSSPLAVTLFPLFAIRAITERRRSEYIAVALVSVAAIVQAASIIKPNSGTIHKITVEAVSLALNGFVGGFLHVYYFAPIAMIVIATLVWFARNRLNRYFYMLVAVYTITCGTIALRIPLEWYAGMPNPATTAPRYSFYPFILLAWILIWVAAVSQTWVRAAIAAVLIAVHVPALPYMQRREDAIDWRKELAICSTQSTYELPIHYNGVAKEAWHVTVSGAECRNLQAWSLL